MQTNSFAFKFFWLFGFHFPEFQSFNSKWEKFINNWPYFVNVFYLLVIVLCFIHFVITSAHLEFRKNFMVIFQIWTVHISSSSILVLNILSQKNQKKFWRILIESDELMVKFLRIELKPTRIKKKTIFLVVTAILFFSGISHAFFNVKRDLGVYEKYSKSSKLCFNINQLLIMKFVYSIHLLRKRLKHFRENFDKIKKNDLNFLTFTRSSSKIWKMSKLIDKVYGTQMVILLTGTCCGALFSGFAMAFNIVRGVSTVLNFYMIIVPILLAFFIVRNCENCVDSVSIIIKSLTN